MTHRHFLTALSPALNGRPCDTLTILSSLKRFECIVFRITLINNIEHLYHSLTMPRQQLKLTHHILSFFAIHQSEHINVFFVSEIAHLSVILREPEPFQETLQRLITIIERCLLASRIRVRSIRHRWLVGRPGLALLGHQLPTLTSGLQTIKLRLWRLLRHESALTLYGHIA